MFLDWHNIEKARVLKTSYGRKKVLITVTLLVCIVLSVTTITSSQIEVFTQNFQNFHSSNWNDAFESSKTGRVFLPAGFKIPASSIKSHLAGTSGDNWKILQLKDKQVMKSPTRGENEFKSTNSILFKESDDEICEYKSHKMEFEVDDSYDLPLDLENVFEIFHEEAVVYGDTYNQHLWPVFENRTFGEHLKSDWYRLLGSSVWLKEYNIHFVVSRLVYSSLSLRNHPRISMLLVQIFDENWEELKNVRLVFPSNSKDSAFGFDVNGQRFTSQRFPRMLPIPFDIGKGHKYWGAEDPRVMLVKNEKGQEEPVVVFNAFHVLPGTDRNIHEVPGIRTMFMSFPFQFQRGKPVETPEEEQTQNDWFTRTKRIKVKGDPQAKLEKNWTPIVGSLESSSEHLMMATQFEPLRMIKCELWTDNDECESLGSAEGKVGALRGGTPLVSVKKIEKSDKEFYVGYARAHLSQCGCGERFYRPNLVVVKRDKDAWKLTHVASFTDLGMDVLPWAPGEGVCHKINAMIPNGIEYWDFDNDVLSLFLTVSDTTVETVHVKGVLGVLEKANVWDDTREEKAISPVSCALDVSKQFCRIYGEKQKGI